MAQQITMKKMGGNDRFSWCVLVNGQVKWDGMSKREAEWRRNKERIDLAGSADPFGTRALFAVRAIQIATGKDLCGTLKFIADCFGFETEMENSQHWNELITWLRANKINLEAVQGPHAVTILKALAARHSNDAR